MVFMDNESIEVSVNQLILKSAEAGLRLQKRDGSMPAGKNGPWNNPETPVRNTAHWAMTFQKAFEITRDKQYLRAAIACCDYLVSGENRPNGFTFYCRKKVARKDCSNGLIGQAWAVEPLLFLGEKHPDKPYWKTADAVLSLHPYDWKQHGWRAVEINGSPLGFSRTLNQQIWFAAMAFIAGEKNEDLRASALDFFGFLSNHFTFLEPGLVCHRMFIKSLGKRVFTRLVDWKKGNDLRSLSIGYQSFILYGLAKLENKYPGRLLTIAKIRDELRSMLEYILRKGPNDYGTNNPFAWSYNPTGIEVACFMQSLSDQLTIDSTAYSPADWLNAQIQRHFDWQNGLMQAGTSDPDVLAARVYEAIDLLAIK